VYEIHGKNILMKVRTVAFSLAESRKVWRAAGLGFGDILDLR